MKVVNRNKENKIQEYIKKMEDPYCFMQGKTKVTMCFEENGRTIEDQLKKYLVNIKEY